ncbi:hypothetical protein LINPERHAP2_LOCUS13296 [Linum perenne]
MLQNQILKPRRPNFVHLEVSGTSLLYVLYYRRSWCYILQVCPRQRHIEEMMLLLGILRRMDASGFVQHMIFLESLQEDTEISTGSLFGGERGLTGSIIFYACKDGGGCLVDAATIEWVTLNIDGSVIPEIGRTTVGGLIRDVDGRCLATFNMKLGICSITRAELRGAVTGLQIAWELAC